MADHNENLKDTLNEEIEHADQKPAEEHYSLNDDRRVKVLSPGMLVAKRFFRNRLAVTPVWRSSCSCLFSPLSAD